MEDIIIELQEIIAHQAEDISRLSEELYTQQGEIIKINKQLEQILEKYHSVIAEGESKYNINQESLPPHY